VAVSLTPIVRAMRSRTTVVAGRVVIGALALVLLPGAVLDLRDVVVRDDRADRGASSEVGRAVDLLSQHVGVAGMSVLAGVGDLGQGRLPTR